MGEVDVADYQQTGKPPKERKDTTSRLFIEDAAINILQLLCKYHEKIASVLSMLSKKIAGLKYIK